MYESHQEEYFKQRVIKSKTITKLLDGFMIRGLDLGMTSPALKTYYTISTL